MLSAVGIVAEYNPFHNGHKYQLEAAKRLSGADVSVAIMSGNWTQRGEPAIFDKWERTALALKGGVDLVIELPFQSAVQPAQLFAKGAVRLASELKCQWLSFGAENPEIDFQKLIVNQPGEKADFKKFNSPYAAIIQEHLYQMTGIKLDSPNDILGFNYASANFDLGSPLKLIPIKRNGSNHNDKFIKNEVTIASASAIRNNIFKSNLDILTNVLPNNVDDLIPVDWNKFWPLLRYQLIESSIDDLQLIYQMTEGIEYRLKKAAVLANDFKSFLDLAKNKRFTYTRLQRLCTYVLMQAKIKMMETDSGYLRILGFNGSGKSYLNQVKKELKVPIVTKVTDREVKKYMELDYKSGMLYKIIGKGDQDFYRSPIIIS